MFKELAYMYHKTQHCWQRLGDVLSCADCYWPFWDQEWVRNDPCVCIQQPVDSRFFVLEYVAVTLKWDMKEIQSNNQGKCSGLEQRRMLCYIVFFGVGHSLVEHTIVLHGIAYYSIA